MDGFCLNFAPDRFPMFKMFKRLWQRIPPAIIVLGTPPVCFFGAIYGWALVDCAISRHEVTAFINEHRHIVDERLADPKVHSFNLSHDPEQFGRLLIRFDVVDKQTYLMLESDLDKRFDLSTMPRWDTTVRSNERLGVDLGGVAQAVGEVAEAWMRIQLAAILSLVAAATVFVFMWYTQRRKVEQDSQKHNTGTC